MRNNDPGQFKASKRLEYINEKVSPLLNEMCFALIVDQPVDPEEFLLRWLEKRCGPARRDTDDLRSRFAGSLDWAMWSGDLAAAITASATVKAANVGNSAIMVSLGCVSEGDTSQRQMATRPSKLSDCEALLLDPGFNCQSRGRIQDDAGLIVNAFARPYDLTGNFQINADTLETFAMAIATESPTHPFHNWTHALDIFQFCYFSLVNGGIGVLLTLLDILVLLTASIAASLGHPATTNAFLVNTSNEISLSYNDRSPIQNYCAGKLFELLRKPGMDYAKNLARADFKVFRFNVIHAILSTDMSMHFALIEKFSTYLSSRKIQSNANVEQIEDRFLMVQIVSHMSSLAHSCRPWDVHKYLVRALESELFAQGDQERAAGLPVSPLMNRSEDSLGAIQDFFLQNLVLPLLQPYQQILSPAVGANCDHMKANQEHWRNLVQHYGPRSAAALISLETGKAEDEGAEHDW